MLLNAIKSQNVFHPKKIWNDFAGKKSCSVRAFKHCEGASRKSEAERKRYFEISRGSLIEIDAALDVAMNLEYLQKIDTENLGNNMITCFRLLTGLINQKQS